MGGTTLQNHLQPNGKLGYFFQNLEVYGKNNKNIGLGNNTFKPQGDWTYINMGSVNYEINYHLNKVISDYLDLKFLMVLILQTHSLVNK